jgi:hypothetical protein
VADCAARRATTALGSWRVSETMRGPLALGAAHLTGAVHHPHDEHDRDNPREHAVLRPDPLLSLQPPRKLQQSLAVSFAVVTAKTGRGIGKPRPSGETAAMR